MLRELSLFDHFVAINFPLPVDAHFALARTYESGVNPAFNTMTMASSIESITLSSAVVSSKTPFPSANKSQRVVTIDPRPHWLAMLVIKETMAAYRKRHLPLLKDKALKLIRDLLSRHAADMRYMSADARQRIAMLYLPLLGGSCPVLPCPVLSCPAIICHVLS